jgi:hypothetical protein
MFFGARKRSGLADDAWAIGEPCASESGERQARQWLAWRRCAQRVTRAWNEWLAADSRQRPARYRCYLSALAEEEQAAAEVERMVAAR